MTRRSIMIKSRIYFLLTLVLLAGIPLIYFSQNVFAQKEEESDDVFFRDDFTGTSLRPEWKIKSEDKDRWMLNGDHLLIITTKSDKGRPNELVFKKNMPQNYELITKIVTILENKTQVEFKLQKDPKNYLLLSLYRDRYGTTRIVFQKTLKGKDSNYTKGIGSVSGDFYFKIIKDGVEFKGYYSFDGGTWNKIGTQLFLNFNGTPMLYAKNWGAIEIGVKFDYVEIKELLK